MGCRRLTYQAMAESVRRMHDVFTAEEFQEKACKLREPVILCGLDLGRAPKQWSPQYLKERGGNHPVKVHVCPHKQMDFISKNFAYKYGGKMGFYQTLS